MLTAQAESEATARERTTDAVPGLSLEGRVLRWQVAGGDADFAAIAAAAEVLVRSLSRWVWRRWGVPALEDLRSAGRLGVWRACKGYKAGRRFGPFCFCVVRGEMLEAVRQAVAAASHGGISLDRAVGEGEDSSLASLLADPRSPDPVAAAELADEWRRVQDAISVSLTARQQELIRNLFIDELTPTEAAAAMKMSRQGIYLAKRSAIRRVRESLEAGRPVEGQEDRGDGDAGDEEERQAALMTVVEDAMATIMAGGGPSATE